MGDNIALPKMFVVVTPILLLLEVSMIIFVIAILVVTLVVTLAGLAIVAVTFPALFRVMHIGERYPHSRG
jgi:uncharacterized membrane protein